MKRNQKGFSTGIVLLLLVFIIGAVLVGWQVYKGRDKKPKPAAVQNTTPQEPKEEVATGPTKTYTDGKKLYSVKYPQDWTAKTSNYTGAFSTTKYDVVQFLAPDAPKTLPNADEKNGVNVVAYEYDGTLQVFVDELFGYPETGDMHKPVKQHINGQDAYYLKQEMATTTDDTYMFPKGAQIVVISLRSKQKAIDPATDGNSFDVTDDLPQFRQIVQSFKFN